jgi:hypothetical protein
MNERILTTKGTLLSREGFVTQTNVEVAAHYDGPNRYIRVGSALYWRDDMDERQDDRITCLASGAVILL